MHWRLRSLQRFGRDAWPLGLFVAAIVLVPLAAVLLFDEAETVGAFCGAAWQVGGVGTVAIGLYRTRQRLGKRSFREWAVSWWSRAKGLFVRPAPAIASGTLSASGSATGRGFADLAVTGSVEQRLEELERRYRQLRDNIDRVEGRLDKEIGELRDAARLESNARERADADLRKLIEDATVGGISLSAVGICWLVVGVLAASFPVHVGWWLLVLLLT